MNNTNENNKLIAEFMGLDTEVFKSGKVNYYYYDKVSKQEIFLEAHELPYNVSWNWLMPVIERINILVMEDDFYELYNSEEWDNITHTLIQIKIKYVYQAVVEFIKEYNKNN